MNAQHRQREIVNPYGLLRPEIHGGLEVGKVRRGELVAELQANDVSHTDLERIYLEHMHD